MRASFERGDLSAWPFDAAYAEQASDPERFLEGARSVVCIAVAYAHAPPLDRPLTGRVSNYAWGEDYHPRVRAILERIAAVIAHLGGRTTIVCDAAPFAERAFAERAGLGWVGKHTNLIVPGAGSFVFLGEAITTLTLEADAPVRKSCGTCTRCIVACPTQALRADYTIDANRCISDLTQRRGIIPREMRPLIGQWIWGCDICQDVCPPTRRGRAVANAAFAPQPDRARPDLTAMLALSAPTFRERFSRSAMGWRGAALLRRNAAIALGNALDRSSVPALEASLATDPSNVVRAHAAWALGRIASPRAIRFLGKRLEYEREAVVCDEIHASLVTVQRMSAF